MKSGAPGVKVVQSPVFGATAQATRVFTPGEVVLAEAPWLVIDAVALHASDPDADAVDPGLLGDAKPGGTVTPPPPSFAAAALRHQIGADFFDALAAADATLTAAAKSTLLRELYSPINHKPSDSALWRSTVMDPSPRELAAAEEVMRTPALFKSPEAHAYWTQQAFQNDAAKLVRFVHGVRVNTHSDDRQGLCAVFLTASKFAHSCAPNTLWFVVADAANDGAEAPSSAAAWPPGYRRMHSVKHVATRRIEKGEPLSFSYIGTGWNLLTHTLERRHKLRHLNFTCQCARCKAFDAGEEACRSLPCLACCARALSSGRHDDGDEPPSRGMAIPADADTAKQCHLRFTPARGGWRCHQCDHSPSVDDTAKALGLEQELVGSTMRAFFVRGADPAAELNGAPLTPATVDSFAQKWALVATLRRRLGAGHYIHTAALCGLLRAVIVLLDAAVAAREALRNNSGGGGGGAKSAPPAAASAAHVDPAGDAAVLPQLVDVAGAAVAGLGWFEKNMRHAPQHARCCSHAVELADHVERLAAACDDKKGQSGAAVGPSQARFEQAFVADAVGRKMLGGLLAKAAPVVSPLAVYAEFAPLVRRVAPARK